MKNINATPDQLNNLYDSLKKGVPLSVALTHCNISQTTYFYWVTLASITHKMREEKELQTLSNLVQDENEIQYTRDNLFQEEEDYQNEIITKFVSPKESQCYRYQKDEEFRNLCDAAYEIIKNCDARRSEAIVYHINKVALDGQRTKNGRINARASMWFLERALPSIFGKKEEEAVKPSRIEKKPIQVEYIDPDTEAMKQRIEKMRNQILNLPPEKVDA